MEFPRICRIKLEARAPLPGRHNRGRLRRRSPAAAPRTPPTVTARPAGDQPAGNRRCSAQGRRLRAAGRESAAGAPSSVADPACPLPGSPPAPQPRLPVSAGGRSPPTPGRRGCRPRPAVAPSRRAGDARHFRRHLRAARASGRARGCEAKAVTHRELPPRALPCRGDPRLRVRAEATSVCVLVRVYLRGASGETGFGLHFAPHRPRAEFLRYPGSGGLRGATRPAPKHPPGSFIRYAAAAAEERPLCAAADAPARTPTRVRVGGLRRRTARVGSAQVRAPRLQGAWPSAMAGSPHPHPTPARCQRWTLHLFARKGRVAANPSGSVGRSGSSVP